MSRHRYVIALAAASAAVLLGAAGIALGGTAPDQVGTTAATAGCGKAPTLTSGQHTIQSGGQNRSFILRIPDNYDSNRPYRLIFGFHWRGGTANDVASGGTDGYTWSYYGLRRLRRTTARSSSRRRASATAGPTPAARTSPSSTT